MIFDMVLLSIKTTHISAKIGFHKDLQKQFQIITFINYLIKICSLCYTVKIILWCSLIFETSAPRYLNNYLWVPCQNMTCLFFGTLHKRRIYFIFPCVSYTKIKQNVK